MATDEKRGEAGAGGGLSGKSLDRFKTTHRYFPALVAFYAISTALTLPSAIPSILKPERRIDLLPLQLMSGGLTVVIWVVLIAVCRYRDLSWAQLEKNHGKVLYQCCSRNIPDELDQVYESKNTHSNWQLLSWPFVFTQFLAVSMNAVLLAWHAVHLHFSPCDDLAVTNAMLTFSVVFAAGGLACIAGPWLPTTDTINKHAESAKELLNPAARTMRKTVNDHANRETEDNSKVIGWVKTAAVIFVVSFGSAALAVVMFVSVHSAANNGVCGGPPQSNLNSASLWLMFVWGAATTAVALGSLFVLYFHQVDRLLRLSRARMRLIGQQLGEQFLQPAAEPVPSAASANDPSLSGGDDEKNALLLGNGAVAVDADCKGLVSWWHARRMLLYDNELDMDVVSHALGAILALMIATTAFCVVALFTNGLLFFASGAVSAVPVVTLLCAGIALSFVLSITSTTDAMVEHIRLLRSFSLERHFHLARPDIPRETFNSASTVYSFAVELADLLERYDQYPTVFTMPVGPGFKRVIFGVMISALTAAGSGVVAKALELF